MTSQRIGMGFDVHKYKKGNGLFICGVFIESDVRVIAHSDGDVALHALMDSILGAIGLGDIGVHFPPTDDKYKGADSKGLLKEVLDMMNLKGFQIVNVDITILCQKPMISPYRDVMKKTVADIVKISHDRVGIKATTTEGLGFLGRVEGIAAYSICSLSEL